MLSQSEFAAWCDNLHLSHQVQELIQRIRTSEPSRTVGGGSKNVFGRYPSRKMGVTIQFESHKVELPFIYQLEHDDNVLEYYDQPNAIKLDYLGKNGRKLGVLHTPDFFVIRKNSAGWEECKTEDHPSLGKSPREDFSQGMIQSGNRNHKLIPYDKNFKILTLPTTKTGKAKVQQSRGVKINSIYYWSNLFRNPEVENTSVPIRYDPFNVGIAYAYVQGQWVECISQYYSEFQGHSEREIKLATSELRKRQRKNNKQSKISAKKLAEFISSIEAEEILLEQRLHDTEASDVLRVINGGKSNSPKVTYITEHQSYKDTEQLNNTSQESPVIEKTLSPDSLVVYEEF